MQALNLISKLADAASNEEQIHGIILIFFFIRNNTYSSCALKTVHIEKNKSVDIKM